MNETIDDTIDVNQKDSHGRTGLHIAAEKGNLVRVKWFLSKNIAIDSQDIKGKKNCSTLCNSIRTC